MLNQPERFLLPGYLEWKEGNHSSSELGKRRRASLVPQICIPVFLTFIEITDSLPTLPFNP